jgi:citrate synthase
MANVLFQITEDHLETGLRGFPVGYCPTSHVDPVQGLFYEEFPIAEVAFWEPQRVIYLLYHGRQGTPEEVADFYQDLLQRERCSEELLAAIQTLPRQGHPMKLLCTAILLAGMIEGTGDYREDCLNIIAKIPEIVATVINYHAGWGPTQPSRPELGYMENFLQMLNLPSVHQTKMSRAELTQAFKLFNVLHYDHSGGNLSTFVGKCIASGLEDMYGALSGAMAALAGPRHGRANQDSLHFIEEMVKAAGNDTSDATIERVIRDRLSKGGLVFGFGHAVLKAEDPRATVVYDFCHKHYSHHPLVKMALRLRVIVPKILAENPKITNPYPNVDGISGCLLAAAGFNYPQYFTVLFGLARVVGIAIQIVYERCEAREGKGLPIVRPNYLYKPR